MNTLNTRVLFLAGLLLSGCAAMPSPEQIQAQREQLERDRARWAEEERRQHEAEREEKEKLKQYEIIVDRLFLAAKNGKIRRSQALAVMLQKGEEMFGPADPAWREKELYVITVMERLEAGEITQAQAEYLAAKMDAEYEVRLKDEQARQEAIAQQEDDRQQSLLIERQRAEEQEIANQRAYRMNLLNIYLNRPRASRSGGPYYNPPPSIRCTSRPFLNSVETECH